MRSTLLLTIALALLGSPTRAADTKPVPIKVVRTWGDLRSQLPIKLLTGQTLRVGLRRSSAPAKGGTLLFVLVEGSAPVPREWKIGGFEEPIGPVLADINHPQVEILKAWRVIGTQAEKLPKDVQRRLYACTLAPPAPGTMAIEIREPKTKRLLASGPLTAPTKPDPLYHPWLTLARAPVEAEAKPHQKADADHFSLLTPRANGPAVPEIAGLRAIDWEQPNRQRPDHTVLPSLIPNQADPTLVLERRGGDLWVKSKTKMTIARPDWHYLCRWWVNGKPHVMRGELDPLADENGIYRLGKSTRIRLIGAARALGAKPGDRLGLQLLYLPDGWRFAGIGVEMLQMAHLDSATGPRLTNRIEWVVGK